MKKQALWKNTYREILKSPGRFFAILGIILLGSGFFIGLRSSRGAMVKTVNTYLKQTCFYDFQLISSLGYSEEEAAGFLEADFVEDAEGAFLQDALVVLQDGDEHAVSFLSLPKRINLPELKEGRLPAKAGECLADASLSHVQVGDVIRISDQNKEACLDCFCVKQVTVTGITESPLYLNYERGTTALGNGQLAGYFYVPMETFDVDYFASVYIRLRDMPDAYTKAYEDRADQLEDRVTKLAKELAHDRYEELYRKAQEELAKGEADYLEGQETYQKERREAEQELGEGWQELEDARGELERANKKLANARRDVAKGEAELMEKKEEAEAEFAKAEKELADAKQQIADGERKVREGSRAYKEGQGKLAAGQSEYDAGMNQWKASEQTYLEGKKSYDAAVQQLQEQEQALQAGALQLQEKEGEYNGAVEQLNQEKAALVAKKQQAAAMAPGEERDALNQEIAAQEQAIAVKEGVLGATKAALEQKKQELAQGTAEIAGAKLLLQQKEKELEEGKKQLDAGRKPLDEAYSKLQAAKAQLDQAGAELADAQRKLEKGRVDYQKGLKELEEGRADYLVQIADAKQELETGKRKLRQGEADYREGMQEYEDGLQEYEEAKQEAEEAFAEAEEELADAKQELEDAKEDLKAFTGPDVYVLGRNANVGYACYDNDSAIVQSIATVFPIFFFLIAALICMTTIGRMVEEQRGQIGVLNALGYSPRETMFKYMVYAGSAATFGACFGVLLGSLVIPQVLWKAYAIMYTYTKRLAYYVDIPLSIGTVVAYLAGMLLVTYLSLRNTLKEVPAAILRPKPPKAGRRVLLERVSFLWQRLSFMWKVTIRNIFRYKERVMMMVLGVAGCTALMITGFGIRDSIQNIVEYQYEEITRYDYEVLFAEAGSKQDRLRFLEHVEPVSEGVMFVHQQSVTAGYERREKNAYLTVISEEERIHDFVSLAAKGQPVSYPGAGEVVINNGLAESLHVSVGDELTLRTEGQVNRFVVSGVFDNYIYNYVYMNADTFRRAFKEKPEWKMAFVKGKEEAGDLTGLLLGEEQVLNVTAGERLKERIGSIMDNLIYVVFLTIVCAAALAFIVIYNLTNINITERMREIATVKVLGFFPGETAGYVLRENILLTALGALVGVPLGIALHTYVMRMIQVELVHFAPRILPLSFVYGIALTAVFGLLVDGVMAQKLNRINEALALKAAE